MSEPKPTEAKAVVVGSGKGGVGKTFIALNIAHALAEKGRRVGLLDSDFSSSTVKDFIRLPAESMDLSGERFHPVEAEGLKVFSASLLMGDSAVSMEGEMYSQLMRDAVEASEWGDVEYIVVDAPPGFGSIWRRTIEVFPNFLGAVIVSNPAHEVHLRRAITLCKDQGVPILGVIENMSWLQVGNVRWNIFGKSRVDEVCREYGVRVFGKIPLTMEIRKLVDAKEPWLHGELAQPVEKAVEAVLEAKPQKPGFLARLKEKVREYVDKALVELVLAANEEIDLPGLQKQHGYPGGSVVQLNIMKPDMREAISQWHFMVHEGKLLAVEGNPGYDYRVDVKVDALKWALLGNRRLSDGSVYDLKSALRLGDLRFYGKASFARAGYFLQTVFTEIAKRRDVVERLKPWLEVL